MEKKKSRALIVCCDGLENGGIQAVIMSVVRNLSHKFDFDLISFSDGEQHYSKEFLKYGKIYHLKKFTPKNAVEKLFSPLLEYSSLSRQFKNFLKENGHYDIIHCHNYFSAAPFLQIAKKHNIGIRVAHCHNVESVEKLKNPLTRLFFKIEKRIIQKYSSDRICCSHAAGEYLFLNDFEVVNNAIDLDVFNPQLFEKSQNENEVFVHVGRYGLQKNQLFLIDVFKEYIEKYNPNARLNLVGFGLWTDKVTKKIDDLKLWDSIKMLESTSNIAKVYSESDIVIYPSTFEGLGISLIEAQAMGLKCYISEAIQPEADLGLCTRLNLSDGAEKWAEFIYKDIRKSGYDKHYVDMSNFDIKNIIKQYDRIYSGN